MKSVVELFNRLGNEKSFENRYPEYNIGDDKIHLLYVSPCLNSVGYYRVISPALELNKTATHRAIVTKIHKWNYNLQLTDYVSPIDSKLIEWADYIVMPVIFENTTYLFQAWRQMNNDVQIVMDLNSNYHLMPKEHLDYSKITVTQKKQLLNTISEIDILTSHSIGLLDFYDNLLDKYFPQSTVMTEYLPSLVSLIGYQKTVSLSQAINKKIKIGIIHSGAEYYDILSVIDILKEIESKFSNEIELVFFGCNGNVPGIKEAISNLKFTYYKPVKFIDYFDRLNEIQLDIALIPNKKIPFNTHGKSIVKFLELSVFGIPVIATNNDLYNEIIKEGENGFLADSAEEWMAKIELLISDQELRSKVGKTALKMVWKNFSYTKENHMYFSNLFI